MQKTQFPWTVLKINLTVFQETKLHKIRQIQIVVVCNSIPLRYTHYTLHVQQHQLHFVLIFKLFRQPVVTSVVVWSSCYVSSFQNDENGYTLHSATTKPTASAQQ